MINRARQANHESGPLLIGQETNGRFTRSLDQRTTTIWDRYTLILQRNRRIPVRLACGDWLLQPNQGHNTGERVAKWPSGLAGTRAYIGKWKNN